MIGVKWTGWDGSVWDLKTGPVRLTDAGIEGLGMLEAEAFTRETALVDGQRFTGWRGKPRDVRLPVLIGPASGDASWLELDRAWWKTMRPHKNGTLTVTAPDGSERFIKARFKSDGGASMSKDPSLDRLSVAPLALTADDPWWRSTMPLQHYENGAPGVNFFGGVPGGKGTPFYVSASSTTANSTLSNPGDIPAYPVYRMIGPLTGFSVVINGRRVSGDILLAPGQILEVDTSPAQQVAWLYTDGVRKNVTRQLTSVEFEPVPEGAESTFDIILVGAGSLSIDLRPQHFKAW